jgi:hypothetical protein
VPIVHRRGQFSTVSGGLSTDLGLLENNCLNNNPQIWAKEKGISDSYKAIKKPPNLHPQK